MTAAVDLACPPRWLHVPAHVATYGDEVADLFAAVGQRLDPEQRLVVAAATAVDETGRLVATELGCAAPRQNVKTHAGKALALADLVLFRIPQALWTAHLRDTAYEVFRNSEGTGLADLFDSYDFLRRLVEDIKDSDGGERSITLRPDKAGEPRPRLVFVARSERGGRGLTGMRVNYDEALFLKASMTSAMVPILSARSMSGQVQVRYLGSPGLPASQVWREVRDRGRPGTARALAWIEWGSERVACEGEHCMHARGTPGCALDREDLVRAANLAVGRRIDLRFVMETERAALTPADYMRERLGWWDDPPGGGLDQFDGAGRWETLADGVAARGAGAVFGVAEAPDRSWSAIGVAWRRPDGAVHLMVADYRPGTAWLAERVTELKERWGGRVFALPKLLDGAEEVSPAERASAASSLDDAITAGRVRHGNQASLNVSVAAARWRMRGEGRVLDRRGETDISPLVAVVLAWHGVVNAPDADGYVI